MPTDVTIENGELHATGEFELNHADLGMQPFSVMMGALQVETAVGLAIAPVLIAATQTVGGSLGSGISPDKSVIGATVAGVQGVEGQITRMALPYGLIGVLIVGLQALVLALLHIP